MNIVEERKLMVIRQYTEGVSLSPVLKFFDFKRETRVTTDASKEGLGALLEQKFDDGWHPIAYGSRSLTKN